MQPTDGEEAALRYALAQVLKELRQERGLSQEELAQASGCHVNHVSFLERGLRVPSLLVVFQIAQGLRTPPSELITLVEKAMVTKPGAG